eukprot:gene6062-6518_t
MSENQEEELLLLLQRQINNAKKLIHEENYDEAKFIYQQCIENYRNFIFNRVTNNNNINNNELFSFNETIFEFAHLSPEQIHRLHQQTLASVIPNQTEARNRVLSQHSLFLQLLKDYAKLHQKLENYDDALLYLTERYEILRSAHGPSAGLTLLALKDIGVCSSEAGDYQMAEDIYQTCLEGYKNAFTLQSKETCDILIHFGRLLQDQFRFNEAESIFNTCYYTRRSLLGPRHPKTLYAQYQWSICYEKNDELMEAEKNYRDIIMKLSASEEIKEQVSDTPTHVAAENDDEDNEEEAHVLASVHSSLGKLLFMQNKKEEAESHYLTSYSLFRESHGEDDPMTLRVLTDLAVVHDSQERYEEALREYEDCYARQVVVLGEDDEDTMKTKDYLDGLKQLLHEKSQNK